MASSTASANASNVMAAANPDKTISKYRNHQYPVELWWTLAAFIGLLTVIHWTTVVIRLTRIKKGPSSVRAGLHFVRAAAFRVQIPYGVGHSINVAEFLAACAYIVTIFTWQFINTTDLKGNRFTLRYWTNRAGHIAAAQFPLLIGLGMKNNFISLLTGVSYEKARRL
ncbi:FAD-binding FR-type domain-containing protein [Mycena indigotica]|uniref:FAD-binding FR-type domain-containing protein n=1 Tax=Mycena indigotica TaxID=2126181 RepID=A0A8H6S2Q1_9AGAR|nr:FAD-binding FR-type domain-containing protein [Mycena indigotica]KAF7291233.1 FAD-binding FR-type domain-containing protein [Mycena indigotica]